MDGSIISIYISLYLFYCLSTASIHLSLSTYLSITPSTSLSLYHIYISICRYFILCVFPYTHPTCTRETMRIGLRFPARVGGSRRLGGWSRVEWSTSCRDVGTDTHYTTQWRLLLQQCNRPKSHKIVRHVRIMNSFYLLPPLVG